MRQARDCSEMEWLDVFQMKTAVSALVLLSRHAASVECAFWQFVFMQRQQKSRQIFGYLGKRM